MQIIEIRLDHLNQQINCQTPSFFAQININSTFSDHITQIHRYFSTYLHPFFTEDNLIIIGPYGEVDYHVPIFIYLNSNHLKAPALEAKYRVKDPAVVLKQKGKIRPKNKLIVLANSILRQIDIVQTQSVEQLLKQLNIVGHCYTSNVMIPQKYEINQLLKFRRPDGNIYIRVQEISDRI